MPDQGFQTFVGTVPAPAVAGDFASSNPRSAVLAGPGGLVAGVNGVTIGRFAWATNAQVDADDAPAAVSNNGTGLPTGFVHREQQGLITTYLANAAMFIPAGFGMGLMSSADFFAKNDGAGVAYPGMKAYASYADGKVSFAATGAPGVASATGTIAAGAGASATGTIVDNLFTAVSGLSGTFVIGGVLSGTNVVTGTQIVSQLLPLLAGEALGGLGRYTVSIAGQSVASTAISETWGVFTAASALVGTFGLGQTLSGTNVPTGSVITALGTGVGGLGTYITNLTGTAGSTTISAGTNIETKYYARSTGAVGELVKMSPVAP